MMTMLILMFVRMLTITIMLMIRVTLMITMMLMITMTLTILKTDSQDDFIGSCTNVTRFVDIVGSSRSHCELVVSGGWHFSRYISRLHFEKDESLSLWSSTLQVSHYLGSERIFLENIDWLCYLCVFLVLNIKYDLLTTPPPLKPCTHISINIFRELFHCFYQNYPSYVATSSAM